MKLNRLIDCSQIERFSKNSNFKKFQNLNEYTWNIKDSINSEDQPKERKLDLTSRIKKNNSLENDVSKNLILKLKSIREKDLTDQTKKKNQEMEQLSMNKQKESILNIVVQRKI